MAGLHDTISQFLEEGELDCSLSLVRVFERILANLGPCVICGSRLNHFDQFLFALVFVVMENAIILDCRLDKSAD